MATASRRLERRKSARNRLDELYTNPLISFVIHYSCESFFDNPTGASRRITSIAILNLDSGQTQSFSIHQIAERSAQRLSVETIQYGYDNLERHMLDDFYESFRTQRNARWIHWNMRDDNFGFGAIAHRYRVLGGSPIVLPDAQLFDLASALIDIYGRDYIGHPRMQRLAERNGITRVGMLSGPDEAAAFDAGEYVKLHQSTLRKVQVIRTIADLEHDRDLKTDAGWWNTHGASFTGVVDALADSWVYKALGRVALLISFLQLVGKLF